MNLCNAMLNFVSSYNGHLQGMTYNLLRCGEESQDVGQKNNLVTETVTTFEDSCDSLSVI